jgi:ribosomal protein RSM22 (predicted rRNA methylase)
MTYIPDEITIEIEKLLQGVSEQKLTAATLALGNFYRWGSFGQLEKLATKEAHLAYLVARLPATYAVNYAVFERIKEHLAAFSPATVLDVGAGPGTSLLASLSHFTQIEKAHLIERDTLFVEYAKKLLAAYEGAPALLFETGDCFEGVKKAEAADLVIASYMLSELSSDAVAPFVKDLWKASNELVVLIETGTPKGYQTLMQARDVLIEQGAFIVAPCPHRLACPIPEGDWCHFSVRLPRSRRHRIVKGAELGYEDEKYCYLVCSKQEFSTRASRVVGPPKQHSGHVTLKLCTPQGTLERPIVSRKMKEGYKAAKSLVWGDTIDLQG